MRNAWAWVVPACAAVMGGCQPRPVPSPYPNLASTIGPSWTMVPLPNAGLQPGTIVQVVQAASGPPAAGAALDLRRLGDLADCGVPASAVVVAASGVPGITAGSTYGFDASLGAKMAGVSAQVSGNLGSQANLTIGTATDSTLDYIAFEQWVTDPGHAQSLAVACGPILSQPGIYVVQEAFVISGGTYSFTTNAGASIAVTPPPSVPVTASVGVKVGSDGGVTITQPIVFALKVLQPVPAGGFQVASIGAAAHLARPVGAAAGLLLAGHVIASVEAK